MTLKGLLCVVFRGGGTYVVEGRDWAPTPTDEEWKTHPWNKHDGRPKPTGYYRRYVSICTTCGDDILTHL